MSQKQIINCITTTIKKENLLHLVANMSVNFEQRFLKFGEWQKDKVKFKKKRIERKKMKLGKKFQACNFLCVWRKKRVVAINHKSFALIKGESRFSPVQHNNHTLFFFLLSYMYEDRRGKITHKETFH